MKKFDLKYAKTLKPVGFWEGFYEISQIPHPTGYEQKLAQHLMKRFEELGCKDIKQDQKGNFVCWIPATKGCEKWPMITIQGHMDMVPNKTVESKHDFLKDPIDVLVDNGVIKANNTTLGADDGVGLSIMFAILHDKTLKHGPIEFLCTVEEETGLVGASHMEKNSLKGKYLLNIDNECGKEVIIGCQACYTQDIHSKFTRKPLPGHKVLKLSLSGLASGHSGSQIHLKRINAIKMMFDLLYNTINGKHPYKVAISNISGGTLKNAIPANFVLELAVDPNDYDFIKSNMTKMLEEYKREFEGGDDNFKYEFSLELPSMDPIDIKRSNEIITMYMAIFNGLNTYDIDHGQSQTSTNLGIIEIVKNEIISHWYARSLFSTGAERVAQMVEACAKLGHSKAIMMDRVQPWSPVHKNNKLLEMWKKIYKEVNKKDIEVNLCPGGLESAVLLDRNESLKGAISIGPDICECHSPTEHIAIASVEPFYQLIRKLLENANKL